MWWSYPSAEMQSVYSAAPADWATQQLLEPHYVKVNADPIKKQSQSTPPNRFFCKKYCLLFSKQRSSRYCYVDALHGCKRNGWRSRMLRAILAKFWKQHPTKHQLYGHLPSIKKTIKVRRTRHAEHCWRSRDEIISDVVR